MQNRSTITKYRACAQKVLWGEPKLKPGQVRDTELNRVKKHHWSPSSIRYLGKNQEISEGRAP